MLLNYKFTINRNLPITLCGYNLKITIEHWYVCHIKILSTPKSHHKLRL